MSDALFSIKPKHVANILSGYKTVELRSRAVNLEPGTIIWIYSTLPTGCVNAYATVEKVHQAHPSVIWNKYSEAIAISKKEFDDYVRDKSIVSAICLTNIYKIEPAISLDDLRHNDEGFHPPQFFKKLSSNNAFLKYMHSLLGVNHRTCSA